MEEPGGGSDERLKVQVKETRAVTNDDIANSGEDDMRVEAEEHSKNMNGTKSKGRAKGRTQIQHKNPPLSKQPLKPMEVQASEEESMAEDQEVSSQQQTRPRKATSGRERAQVKQYTKGVDDIIRDGERTATMGYSISTPKSINTERMLQDNTINKQWNESRRYVLWRVSNENQNRGRSV